MASDLIFKIVCGVVIFFVGIDVYRERNHIFKKKKNYTIKDMYVSSGFVIEGIILECKANDESKRRHLETLDYLIIRLPQESSERNELNELRQEILLGNSETQIEKSLGKYQSKMIELQDENIELLDRYHSKKDELKKLRNENRKLRSYQRNQRRI